MMETDDVTGSGITYEDDAYRYYLRRIFVEAHRRVMDRDDDDRDLEENSRLTFMMTVLVVVFMMFLVICTYQVFQIWFCKVCCGREEPRLANGTMTVNSNGDAILLNDGIVFRLTRQQRRMVLESIFSASAKAVTDQDVSPKKKVKRKKRKNDDDSEDEDEEIIEMPIDAVEIPCTPTIDTEISNNNNNENNRNNNNDFQNSTDLATTDDNRDSPSIHSDETSETSDTLSNNNTPSMQATTTTTANDLSNISSNATDECSFATENEPILSSTCIEEELASGQPGLPKSTTEYSASEEQKESSSEKKNGACCCGLQVVPGNTIIEKEVASIEKGRGESNKSSGLRNNGTSISIADNSLIVDESTRPGLANDTAVGCFDCEDKTCTKMVHCNTSNMADETDKDDSEKNDDDKLTEMVGQNDIRNIFKTGLPHDGEETKEEIQDVRETASAVLQTVHSNDAFEDENNHTALSSSLHLPIPLTTRESFATTASEYTYDDDSTTGDVCPICICGYKKGDLLVISKHCTHVFHKDCILEWLTKHDECPVCRVGMVTDSELNSAATSVVGRTRLYQHSQRATTSYQRFRADQRSVYNNYGAGSNSMQAWREAPRTYPRFR